MGKKLFSYVIGNPPYQEETSQGSLINGQRSRKNVFHYFQIAAEQLAEVGTVLVYPGGRWLHQSGKGLKKFGYEQINDCHLSRVLFYPNAKELFPTTDIPDGITIVVKSVRKTSDGFAYVYVKNGDETEVYVNNPGDDLIPLNPNDLSILIKIDAFVRAYNIRYLHDFILPRSLFGIESDFVEKNPDRVLEYDEKQTYDWNHYVKVFTNDKAGAAGRSKWFVVNRDVIRQNERYLSEWQVVVSSAHAGGQEGRDNQISVIDNHSAFGRARVALASFQTELEAVNFFKYAGSTVIKYAFLMSDEALSALGKRVPDIVDYSAGNSIIDFSCDVDTQLRKLIGFSDNEWSYILQCVSDAGKKRR